MIFLLLADAFPNKIDLKLQLNKKLLFSIMCFKGWFPVQFEMHDS